MLLHVFGSPVCVRVWLCPIDPAGSFGERTLRPVALWASTALVLLQAMMQTIAGRGELLNCLGALSFVILLMQISSLGSSRMVVPLPSSRCLAEGNRISRFLKLNNSVEVVRLKLLVRGK